METRLCRCCGCDLIGSNEYRSKKRRNLGRICKLCHIKEMKKRYKKGKRHFFITTSNYCIFFESRQDKVAFINYRNILRKTHKYPAEHSSSCGCAIDEWVEIDGKPVLQRLYCDECGSIVRYNKNKEKECEGCGLIFS